jgi:hypothetical protein
VMQRIFFPRASNFPKPIVTNQTRSKYLGYPLETRKGYVRLCWVMRLGTKYHAIPYTLCTYVHTVRFPFCAMHTGTASLTYTIEFHYRNRRVRRAGCPRCSHALPSA